MLERLLLMVLKIVLICDKFSKGLLKLTVADPKNCPVPYKIGVMGVVVVAGGVSSNDEIKLIFPPVPHEPMTKV